jgi:DNA-binding NarL/FixJ family response regulator
MGTNRIRVLCVDDHRIVREGIALIINRQRDMEVVGTAASGEEAVELFKRRQPDVTLMDLQLGAMSGVQTIKAIRAEDPKARVVALTMYQGDEDIHRAVQAGAVAYLLKDTVPDVLVRVIRDVHAGRRVFPPEVLAAIKRRAGQPALTSREVQVLELLAEGKRTKEIAVSLGVTIDTANAHIKNIYSKFAVHRRGAIVSEAIRRGFIRRDRSTFGV